MGHGGRVMVWWTMSGRKVLWSAVVGALLVSACGDSEVTEDSNAPTEQSRVALAQVNNAELRESDHYFFRLSEFADFLKDWTTSGTLQPQIVNKLDEWLEKNKGHGFGGHPYRTADRG